MPPSEAYSTRCRRSAAEFGVLLAVTLLVFGRALFNEYAYDAELLLPRWAVDNPPPFSILWDSKNFGPATGILSYRPLGAFLFMLLDGRIFGGNPALSNLVNHLLHAANGWLLLGALRLFTKEKFAAWGSALFFLLHPLVTEVVYCAGFRFDLLALFFTLLGLRAVLDGDGPPTPVRIALAAGCVLLGLASKEIAIVALPMIPLAVALRERSTKAALPLAGALFFTTVAFLVVWKHFQYAHYPDKFLGGGGRVLGIANFLVSTTEVYFRKLMLPWPLRVDYRFEPVASVAHVRVLVALLVMLLLGGAWALLVRREKLALLGVAWVVAAFLPMAQLLPTPDPVAERFCYVPLAGVAMIVAAVLMAEVRSRCPRKPLRTIMIVILALCAAVSFRRGADWRDDLTLNIANWEQPGDKRPVAHENLGALYLLRAARPEAQAAAKAVDLATARRHLDELLRAAPDNPDGLRMMGVWHLMHNDREEAARFARRAAELAPDDPKVRQLLHAIDLSTTGK